MKKNRKKDYSQALKEEFEAFFAVNHSSALCEFMPTMEQRIFFPVKKY
jgi:hypothetical protein